MSAEFTKGEMKVLRCLVRGLSYNEIAKELGIEPSTVKYLSLIHIYGYRE